MHLDPSFAYYVPRTLNRTSVTYVGFLIFEAYRTIVSYRHKKGILYQRTVLLSEN